MSTYTLHSYFRSSCTARVRIALHYKAIPFEDVPLSLLKNEHLTEAHRALNPSASVPLLVVKHRDGSSFKIGQSLAILDYLEEVSPDRPLMPATLDAQRRAIVRTLVNIIACDTQPVTNLKIKRRLEDSGVDPAPWMKDLTTDGLAAYEAVAKEWAGDFSVGDEMTMADVCLLPAFWNADKFGVDLSQLPTISRIAERLNQIPEVAKAHYYRQPDTPDDLRIQ